LEEDVIFYIFSLKKHRALLMTVFIFGLTQRGYMNEWSFVSCTFFFTISLFFGRTNKNIVFKYFFLIETNFYVTPHPKQYPFPMAPKKYSFIKENVIIGKRKWKFQFGVVVARRKKISNISRRSAAKREGESQFLPPRAAGGPLKENSI